MTAVPRPAMAALLVFVVALLAAPAESSRRREAEGLYRHAVTMLERNTFDTRRIAISELEQATRLDPNRAAYQLALARVYYQAGFMKSARARYARVVEIDPRDPEGPYGLGLVSRRDWLKYLTPLSLTKSIEYFSTVVHLRPDHVDGWLMLTPLLFEQGDLPGAAAAARHAADADPRRAEATLAVAYTSYRMSHVERADSAFRLAIPRLPQRVRERFEDISPVATERDTMTLHHLPAEMQPDFLRRFWKDNDPDLATEVNEAQVEYWARVAHAYFLFYDQRRREWDERGEVYVRYGPPQHREYNPVGLSLRDWFGMPSNVLVWNYPSLGMRVALEDRLLSEFYLLPISREEDMDPRPNPDMVAGLDDVLEMSGGRGVFPKLPPGIRPLPLSGAIARFEGEDRTRLLAQVESPGGPGASLKAEWVVLDSVRREVARGSRMLSPSACAATERQVGDFAADLPEGKYLVGMTVSDGAGRRGVFRGDVEVHGASAERLELSDVVVTCGTPRVGEQTLRIEPNPAARVETGQALTAYFEIYHLKLDERGQSRFEMAYTVKSAERDERIWLRRLFAPRQAPSPITASREETQPGSLRRQFVTVPVEGLPAGRYRLEIKVKDLNRGQEAVERGEFTKSTFAVGG